MMNSKKMKENLFAVVSFLLLLIMDQVTKKMAVAYLKDQADIPIIKDVFELSYVENRGAAFGMMQNKQIFFIIMTVAVLVGILWIYHRIPFERRYIPMKVSLVLLATGAVGNFIDRLRLQYVVDFFYFKLIDFPVFNVADIYVVVSVFLLALLILFYYKEEEMDNILKVEKK